MQNSPSLCIKTLSKCLGETINYYLTCFNLNNYATNKERNLFKLEKSNFQEDIKPTDEKEVDFIEKLKKLKTTVEEIKTKAVEKGKELIDKVMDNKTEENEEATEKPRKIILKEETGDEILLVSESAILFIGMNYQQGLRDKISFDNLVSIELLIGKEFDTINFKGISDYDLNLWNVKEAGKPKKDFVYSYEVTDGENLTKLIRSLYEIYFFSVHQKKQKLDYEKKRKKEEEVDDKDSSILQKGLQLKPNEVDENPEESEEGEDDQENMQFDESNLPNFTGNLYPHIEKPVLNFAFKGYGFNLPSGFSEDIVDPGNYYLNPTKATKKKINDGAPFQTKVRIFVNDEMPIENLLDNSSLSSLKYQTIDNLNYYLKESISDLGIYYTEPLSKFRIVPQKKYDEIKKAEGDQNNDDSELVEEMNEEEFPSSEWKGYKMTIRTKPEGLFGYKILYCYLRRKFIPPFYDTFNDFSILIIENYSLSKGDYYFEKKTNRIFENLVKTITPLHEVRGNCITKMMIKDKIKGYLTDGKSFKYLKNFVGFWDDDVNTPKNLIDDSLPNPHIAVQEFRTKMNIIMEKYSKKKPNKKKSDEEKDKGFYEEIKTILAKGTTKFDIEEYKKDILFRQFRDIIAFPLKKFEKTFAKKDPQTEVFYELKIIKFISQNMVEKIYNYRILDQVIAMAKKKEDFLNEIKEALNILIGFYVLDYDNQVKNDVDIQYIVDHNYEIQDIFFDEKFLCRLIEHGILEKSQGITTHVTYFKFLNYILEKKFTYKLCLAVSNYLENLVQETSSIKSPQDLLDREEEHKIIIENTDILVPNIFNIFTKYSQNSLITIISCKCLQNLILLDYRNMKFFYSGDFFSFLGQHFLSSNNNIVYNAIYLLALLTQSKYEQTLIFSKNHDLLIKLVNIFRGLNIETHKYHPEIILLLLKYFSRLIKNSHIYDFLNRENNKKFIKFILKYLTNYEDSFSKDDIEESAFNYFEIHTALFKFLCYYIDSGTEQKKYLEQNFQINSSLDKKFEEFNLIIDEGKKEIQEKSDRTTLNSLVELLEAVLLFLQEYTGSDERKINGYKTYYINIYYFIENCGDYAKVVSDWFKSRGLEIKKEIIQIIDYTNDISDKMGL